jgi:hypothetical protein
VDCAIKIAARLQSQSSVTSQSVDKAANNSYRSALSRPNSFRVQTSGKRPREASVRPAPPAPLAPLSDAEEKQLLKRFNRCYKCAWRLDKGKQHPCEPLAKAKRVDAIRREQLGASSSREAAV